MRELWFERLIDNSNYTRSFCQLSVVHLARPSLSSQRAYSLSVVLQILNPSMTWSNISSWQLYSQICQTRWITVSPETATCMWQIQECDCVLYPSRWKSCKYTIITLSPSLPESVRTCLSVALSHFVWSSSILILFFAVVTSCISQYVTD